MKKEDAQKTNMESSEDFSLEDLEHDLENADLEDLLQHADLTYSLLQEVTTRMNSIKEELRYRYEQGDFTKADVRTYHIYVTKGYTRETIDSNRIKDLDLTPLEIAALFDVKTSYKIKQDPELLELLPQEKKDLLQKHTKTKTVKASVRFEKL